MPSLRQAAGLTQKPSKKKHHGKPQERVNNMALIGYNTGAELTSYAAARGQTLSQDADVLLTLALDYLELQNYSGEKTDPSQALEFPRNGETVVPSRIKTAQLVAAMLYSDGEDLLAPMGQRVTSETVVGAVSVTYSDSGNQTAVYGQLDALLEPFMLASGSMFTFEVKRV